MTAGPRRILHIGQRKTATTWLQFGAQRAADAGRLDYDQWSIAKWVQGVKPNAATPADYATFAGLLPAASDRPAFASCEGLMVHDPAKVAAAIRDRWPGAHVLVTTRAPQDYLLSSFNNASMTRHETPAEFVARFSRRHLPRSHDFDGVAAAFGAAFGPDHVHFLPFEMLRDDREAYVDRLEALFGLVLRGCLRTDALNASPPPAYLAIARRVNEMIDERAPEILETPEWRHFMRIANFSAGAAQGLDAYFADFFRGGFLPTDALPLLDAATEKQLAGRMTVLETLADYRPYLGLYGVPAAA